MLLPLCYGGLAPPCVVVVVSVRAVAADRQADAGVGLAPESKFF